MSRNPELFGGFSKKMRTNGGDPRQTKNHELSQNNQISCLLTAVRDKSADIKHGCQVGNLPSDLIFQILLLLPAESLHRSSFVCKEWFSLINSSKFIEAYCRQSETVFVSLKTSPTRPKSFKIEAKLGLPENFSIFPTHEPSRYYIDFLKVEGGRCKVIESNISGFKDLLATCNGLILATCKQNGGLLVFNPLTRKLSALPLGTTLPFEESYGFVFNHLTKQYKVVHLFRDGTQYIGCEILSLTSRLWRGVDGPSHGLFTSFDHKPVSAIGGLHWLPSSDRCGQIVSMGIDDEKFRTTSLPISSTPNDRLVEIGGFLSFVTHVEFHKLDVWMLKGLEGEHWVKRHIITGYRVTDLVPLSTWRCGRELIFKVKEQACFYVYDIEKEEMSMAEMEGDAPAEIVEDARGRRRRYLPHGITPHYLPHLNTLTPGDWLG